MTNEIKWDRRFLALAAQVACWSKDPSTQVGAVIVRGRHVIATGYNGFPPGVADTDDRLFTRATKLLYTVHAEANALAQCAMHGQRAEGATIYVTHPPCAGCMRLLIAAGIARVVYPALDDDFAARWAAELTAAGEMAAETGVAISVIAPPKWDRAATEACK
jgi:dCMP deaminase